MIEITQMPPDVLGSPVPLRPGQALDRANRVIHRASVVIGVANATLGEALNTKDDPEFIEDVYDDRDLLYAIRRRARELRDETRAQMQDYSLDSLVPRSWGAW